LAGKSARSLTRFHVLCKQIFNKTLQWQNPMGITVDGATEDGGQRLWCGTGNASMYPLVKHLCVVRRTDDLFHFSSSFKNLK
jgi:hypothetical protein